MALGSLNLAGVRRHEGQTFEDAMGCLVYLPKCGVLYSLRSPNAPMCFAVIKVSFLCKLQPRRYVDILLMMTLMFVMIAIDYKSVYTIGPDLSSVAGTLLA